MRKLMVCAVAVLALVVPATPAAASQPGRPSSNAALVQQDLFIRSTEGVRLHVHSVGGGPGARVVVFVHGGAGLSLETLSFFDALASHSLQVVGYDQRGSGTSSAPANGDYSLDADIADLGAVQRWTGAAQIAIAGHSWGGVPAQAYTATHPDRVSTLILLDAIPLNWRAALAGFANQAARIAALQRKGLIPNTLPPVRHDSCLAQVKAITPAYLASPREAAPPGLWGPSCSAAEGDATFLGFVDARKRLPALTEALGRWRGDALVVQGSRDLFGLVWLRTSVKQLKSATTEQLAVPDAGHFPWIERPGQVLSAVGPYLR
jgi:pimeloyl-ACP methyl ester carboxylesterase